MQKDKVDKYIKEHYCEEFKDGAGGFGSTSKLSFIVGSTSIGPTLRIYCPYCHYKEDITDVDTW
jgi:hypothetical protein